jgi:hypothetical protein
MSEMCGKVKKSPENGNLPWLNYLIKKKSMYNGAREKKRSKKCK